MKRLLILTLTVVLLAGMLVIPAAAQTDSTAALTDATVYPGQTATLILSLEGFGMANTLGVTISLPEGLTLDKDASEWLLEGQLSDISDPLAAWTAMDAVDMDADVLALGIVIPEGAAAGTVYTVECTVMVKNNQENLGSAAASGTITVTEEHTHVYVDTVVPPSCLESGYTEHVCDCGESYIDTPVAALGHTEETLVGREASCSKNGLTNGKKCSVCNVVTVPQVVTPATGQHTYDNSRDTTCNVCGHVRVVRPKSVPMYRMYDPNSSEHFYTGSTEERDILVVAGWNYEGVGFNFPISGSPVHRLYEPETGEHLYTMDNAEKSRLLVSGWNYEGVAFNSAGTDEVPQYRLHNPNASRGAYHFTGSEVERDTLIALGWEYQGIGWYSCKY